MKKLLAFILLFCVCSPLWANVSPKPEMEFSFIYNTQAKPLIDPLHSEQIQCADNQCIQSAPLGHYGIQKLYCGAGACTSVAYEYDNFQKLIIAFADGTKRESNIFPAPDSLRSRFNVYVGNDSLTVEPAEVLSETPAWARTDAWVSLVIILLLEILAALAYLMYTQKPFTILYSVAISNVLSTAAAWLLFVQFVKETALLWLFCLLAEAVIIRLMNPHKMPIKDALILSTVMNVTSYSLGMIISFWFAPLIF